MNDVASPLAEWLTRLETLSPREIDMGLERVDRVLARLALPRPQFVIHVAGTNGKGSSVAMLESLLSKTGTSIGCYTSPHIRHYNERIRVDGTLATDEQIVAAFERVEAHRDGEALTYFEFGTLAALVVFAEADIETVILEVGMGGRLDAVNAVEPDIGLITNISLDHCDWLGDNIEAIAFEKAGIMRTATPIIFGSRDRPASIDRQAAEVGATLIAAQRDFDWSTAGEQWSWHGVAHRIEGLDRPALLGEHQIGNAATVLTVLEAAGFVELLDTDLINEAFAALHLDGRMQDVSLESHWILDVAHNPAAATALAETLRTTAFAGRTIAVLAMLDDKDVEGCVTPLQHQIDLWIAATADSSRAIEAGELARRIANSTNTACEIADSLDDAIGRARSMATPEDRVLVFGSFYVVGPVLERLYSLSQS